MARTSSIAARLVLVLALLVSTQGALLVRGLFEVRQEWISEHLCENRNHPERECNGMCVLKRQMEEHSHHGDEGGTEAILTMPTVIALLAPEATVPPDRWRKATTPTVGDERVPDGGALEGVFRPPRVG
ncbi:hypothetical protein [Rubrivirga marina]|uniref:Uncharacterized protein n=1 Tax=Rubrivirga marina TaxID=1196024 RepID=A0A271J3X9_9BACT|nr:hypothetical protein [Rubrivirga marina]PAP78153.1 hypothetical protein BSZ37_17790 [Rubrivirga marina]